MIDGRPGFEDLCREHTLAESELDQLAGDSRPTAVDRAAMLRKQHAMIEDEILTAIARCSPT
ncbi:hypothetical protein [Rhodoblastus sp.]|uniref:hypothetical protein n=1 Tax=Rhodoblastus sp. TaxID=1962975 RepID=UPI00260BDF65|nr:hypothetical protein [Rhodoblastus sp.]